MFGGYYEQVQHDLRVISVDDFFSPHENPLILLMVGLALMIYIVLVLMMKPSTSDDDAKRRSRLIFLQDNSPSHKYKYELVVETGFHPDAGTSSKVSFKLHGEEGVSETRELITVDNAAIFEHNSRNRFIMTLPDPLGHIYKIQFWHNNTGTSPAWFLRQVIVKDLHSGQAYYFLCQKWMAIDRGDGKIEREFLILDGSAMTFSQVFVIKGSQYLCDFHTWLSVITCPSYSPFSRTQRLFTCLALTMTYMGLATVWFQLSPSPIRGEFELFDVSWKNMLIGFLICCMVFPINLIMAFFFRRSCVNTEVTKLSQKGKSKIDLISQGDEEAPSGVIPYSILDQSILNWQHIQEWAHKQWQKRQSHIISGLDTVKEAAQTEQYQLSPSMVPLVQHTMLAGEDDLELGSSGFEDATSQATADRNRIFTPSDLSSVEKKSESETSNKHQSKRRLLLPSWCCYISWILGLLIIVAGSTVTVWYGFRFSYRRSVMWIQSVYFSLVTCLFILQPLMIFLKTLVTCIRHCHNPAVIDMALDMEDDFDLEWEERRHRELSSWHEDDEMQKNLAARARSRYLRCAGPLQEKELQPTRRRMLREKRALSLLKNGTNLTFLTLLVMVLAFGRNRGYQAQFNQAVYGNLNEKSSFIGIKSIHDWYNWSKTSLMPSLLSIENLRNAKQNKEFSSLGVVIGKVQLRKFQANPEACYPLRSFGFKEDCSRDDNNRVFYPNKDFSIWGQLSWYKNGNSVVTLDQDRNKLSSQLNDLKSANWLSQMEAVVVEMTVYNPPSRLYSSISLLAEMSPCGNVLPSVSIRSTQLFHFITNWDNFLLACELAFIVLAIAMMCGTIQKMFHQQRSFFKQFSNYNEVLMCLTSLFYIGLFSYRFVIVMEIVETLRNTFYEEYVSFGFLTLWDEIIHTVLGILLFCLLVKWLSVLSYNPTIAKLNRVYLRCRKEILLASGIFLVQLVACSSLGQLLFTSIYRPLSSFSKSLMTVTALSIRIMDAFESTDSYYGNNISIFFMFSYVFLHCLVGVYLFSVLAYRFKTTKLKRRLSMSPRKLLHFYCNFFWGKTRRQKYKQHMEYEYTLSPEFLIAETMYLVDELLFRMNNLLGTSGLPEKYNSFSDSDSSPDLGDDGISTGDSEEFHDKHYLIDEDYGALTELNRLEDRVHRIEDKLCSNEPYLAQLLKLDSFGANVLSADEEHKLRSELEFEIFQQLQKQRRENTSVFEPILFHNALKAKSELKNLNDINAVRMIHNQESTNKKLHSPKSPTEIKFPELHQVEELRLPTKHHPVVSTNLNTKSLKRSQSLKVPVRENVSLFETGQVAKKNREMYCFDKDYDANNSQTKSVNRHSSVKGKKEMMAFDQLNKKELRLISNAPLFRRSVNKPGEIMEKEKELITLTQKLSSGNASPQSSESEKGHKRTDSSSGQSAVESRMNTPKLTSKRLDLPPRSMFSHAVKSRPFDFVGEWPAESSSGSEQEAGLGSKWLPSMGRRNLRKTKSRGKGKGDDVDIDSAIVLGKDFQTERHRGIVDCSIIIHPVPANVDLDEISIPEEL